MDTVNCQDGMGMCGKVGKEWGKVLWFPSTVHNYGLCSISSRSDKFKFGNGDYPEQ